MSLFVLDVSNARCLLLGNWEQNLNENAQKKTTDHRQDLSNKKTYDKTRNV